VTGKRSSPFVFLQVALRKTSILVEDDLGVAEWAMLELQILQLLVECLMLADLACVVFLLDDAHTTGDTGRVVAATFLATDVEFCDDGIAFRTVGFLLRFVVRSISRE